MKQCVSNFLSIISMLLFLVTVVSYITFHSISTHPNTQSVLGKRTLRVRPPIISSSPLPKLKLMPPKRKFIIEHKADDLIV